MEDLPVRFADLVESVASRVRALTVDRVARYIRIASVSLILVVLALLTVIFLFATIYGALEIPLGSWGAFATMGGLFGIGAAFMWRRRSRPSKDEP